MHWPFNSLGCLDLEKFECTLDYVRYAPNMLLAPTVFISPSMGTSVTLQAFAAAVLGGFGSVAGAACGGLILGLAQVYTAAYISGSYADGAALLLLIAVLVIRPQGLFRTAW